jgi:hypothetical protein
MGSPGLLGGDLSKVAAGVGLSTPGGKPGTSPRAGNAVLVAFLLVQVLDGGLTYLGLQTFGPDIEGNPLLAWLMASFGEGPALAGAKVVAGTLAIALHLTALHRALALLTLFYVTTAIIPWTLLFWLW